jgi:hypothetical protein
MEVIDPEDFLSSPESRNAEAHAPSPKKITCARAQYAATMGPVDKRSVPIPGGRCPVRLMSKGFDHALS